LTVKIGVFRKAVERVLRTVPPDLLGNLNGGFVVLPEEKPDGEYVIMGEYIEDPALGNMVVLYYGSFVDQLGEAPEEEWVEEIEETVFHELRHHVELMAGVDDLSEEERAELP
jgi:predicted Zn-dependent protease with MMP-like domain